MKHLPDTLAAHILPFDWDVRLVWQESAEVTVRPLADFAYLLDLPLWSSIPHQGMLFDVSPREIIASPQRSPYQYERIVKADTDFPIDLLHYQEREWILDGVHRLAKLFLIEAESVKVRVHSEEIIPRIAR